MAQCCVQFQHQLDLGYLDPLSLEYRTNVSGYKPMKLHAISWWDEKHMKVILGHISKTERRVSMNEFDEITHPEFGGRFRHWRPNQTMKYAGDVRFLFGAAYVILPNGREEGRKAEPFEYTGLKSSVFVKEYAKLQ